MANKKPMNAEFRVVKGEKKMAYIKEYWQNKEQRATIAREHTKEMQNKYCRCIQTAISATKIYDTDSFNRDFEEDIEDKDTKIIVENIDSVGAVMKYGNSNTAVLNFSSYKNPGGMFLNGSKAQEECLCHESFLYNVLSQFVLEFYDWNNRHKNKALYLNRGLFSPGVWFFRDNSHVECSVITCAAPNKSAAQKYQNVSDEENTKVLRSRIKFVLDMAKDNNVSTLILGAYGCGVFGQDPYEVATIFKYLLNNKRYGFELVVFAIPYGTRQDNFISFCEVLNNKITNIDNPRVRDLLKKC